MEIKNYRSAVTAYVKNTYEPAKKKCTSSAVKNTDKAEFSAASGAGALANAKIAAKQSVESFASPERIAALKSMIADGSYDISADDVAASIFEG
ncbi:MAG: flagellar biosynthesis anti-sigma factor FlgM [Oscillospiraceae bacterium]|nr:flagellar biosynthesis anti-sigma factor FlgM [Oscillospiraceae bacterium]